MEDLTLFDYVAILRRWKKVFLASGIVLLLLSSVFVMRWTNYRSTAVVQVEQSDIASMATMPVGANPRDAMEALADQRISEIQQKVLSTASLIEIITKFNLYAAERENTPIADIAERMRKKIKIELVSSTLANPAAATRGSAQQLAAIAFKLSYDYKVPLTTQQVADELVSRFLDQDLKDRRTETKETVAFLGAQIEALEQSLAEQEKKIADFQKEHGVARPESLLFNQQAAASITMNLNSVNSQITSVEGSLGSLRGQLASVDPYSRVLAQGQILTTPSVQLKALQAQYAELTARYGAEHPDVVKTRHQIEALQTHVGGGDRQNVAQLKAQITDTRTNVEAAKKTYGADHPDVKALQSQLQKLEDQLALQKHSASAGGLISDADNPSYLQLVSQINAAQEQLKSLMNQRKELMDQQNVYQKAIIENPQAQQEMAALTRDYDNSQLRYREMKEKKMAADMSLQLQQDRKGERLSLINPPELPLHTQPRRLLLLLAAAFVSLMGSLGIVAAVQIMTQSVIGLNQVESIAGATPLVAVPHIMTPEEKARSGKRYALRTALALKDLIAGKFGRRASRTEKV